MSIQKVWMLISSINLMFKKFLKKYLLTKIYLLEIQLSGIQHKISSKTTLPKLAQKNKTKQTQDLNIMQSVDKNGKYQLNKHNTFVLNTKTRSYNNCKNNRNKQKQEYQTNDNIYIPIVYTHYNNTYQSMKSTNNSTNLIQEQRNLLKKIYNQG